MLTMPFRLLRRHEGVVNHFVDAERSDQIEETSGVERPYDAPVPYFNKRTSWTNSSPVATSTTPFPLVEGSESFEDLAVGRIPMGTFRERVRGIPALHPYLGAQGCGEAA